MYLHNRQPIHENFTLRVTMDPIGQFGWVAKQKKVSYDNFCLPKGRHSDAAHEIRLIEVLNNQISARGLTCFASIGMAHEKIYSPQIRLSERGQ